MSYAVDEYSFDLQYNGTIVKNVEKQAVAVLTGVNGTPHSNVRIDFDITGPATPELLAIDSYGAELNIAQIGYWGPVGGFPVGGSFINPTTIRATFPEEGNYTITLKLVDVANANAVITSRTFNLEVFEDQTNIPANTIVPANKIEELPKTGISIFDGMLYVASLGVILCLVAAYLKSRAVR